jgi:nucleoside-diphosphate-sugar epimerase
MSQKVLVTGGSGFLGINIIRTLLDQGITDITSLDLEPFDYPEQNRINDVVGDIRQ